MSTNSIDCITTLMDKFFEVYYERQEIKLWKWKKDMLDNLILGKWENRNFAQLFWFSLSIRNGWISFFLFSNQTGCRVWVQVCPGPNKNLFGSTNKVLSGSSVLVQIVLYNMRKQHHNENLVFLFSNPKYMFDIFS